MEHIRAPKLTSWHSVKKADDCISKFSREMMDLKKEQSEYDRVLQCGRKFAHAYHAAQAQQTNYALMELKKHKERILSECSEIGRQVEKIMPNKVQIQGQTPLLSERSRGKNEIAEIRKGEEKRGHKRGKVMFQQHRDEKPDQDFMIPKQKKKGLMSGLQNTRDQETKKEMEVTKEKREDQCAEQIRREIEAQKRQKSSREVVRLRQMRTELVSHKLEIMQKEQAAMQAVKEEEEQINLRSYRAKIENQKREEREKEVVDIQSLMIFRKIQAKSKMKEEVKEKMREREWIVAQKAFDKIKIVNEKEKALEEKEESIGIHNFNVAAAAKKRKAEEQKKRDEQLAALKAAKEAEENRKIQRTIQRKFLLDEGLREKTVDTILAKSTGGPGLLKDRMDDGYNDSQTNEPLLRMSTKQTRLTKRRQQQNGLLKGRCSEKSRSNLPPIHHQQHKKHLNGPFIVLNPLEKTKMVKEKEKALKLKEVSIAVQNFSAAEAAKKREAAEEKKRRDAQQAALKAAREAEEKRKLQTTIETKCVLDVSAKEMNRNDILGKSTGRLLPLRLRMGECYNCIVTNERLPRISTNETRLTKHCQENIGLLTRRYSERCMMNLPPEHQQLRNKHLNVPFLVYSFTDSPHWKN